MRRFSLIFSFVLLTACAAPQEIIQSTKTSVPSTATPVPTQTPLPSPTSAPTPEPYLLEEGVLLDWAESSGEYIIVAEEIDALTAAAEGEILALDGDGFPRFVFENGDWVEIKIPEGAESFSELAVPDRYVSKVNEEGVVEEVLETGTKVLVNLETEEYEYEFINGEWVDYVPRVMVVGEASRPFEVPREVIETAAETIENAEMFKRIINGKTVELKTGLDEKWGEFESSKGGIYIQWYGVLCGVVERSSEVFALLGVEMNSGDILLINTLFHKADRGFSSASLVIEGGVMPNEYEAQLDSMKALGRSIDRNQIANALLKSPIGTPLYISILVNNNLAEPEGRKIWNAMKSEEFLGSADSSIFDPILLGASDTFFDLAESQ